MAPLIPRIGSAKVGSKPLVYPIRPGSDFWGDRIRCDTGLWTMAQARPGGQEKGVRHLKKKKKKKKKE